MLLNVLSVWRLLALTVLLSCLSQAVPLPLSPETTVSADLSDAHVKYKHLKYVVNRDHYLPPPVPHLSSPLGASGGDGNFLSSFWSSSPSDQISTSRPSLKNVDEDDLIIHESVRIEYDDEDIEISDDEGMVDEEFDEDLEDLLESFHDSDDDKKLPSSAPIQSDQFKDLSANNDTTSQPQPQPQPQPQLQPPPQAQPQLQDGDIVMVPDCSNPVGNMGPDLDLNPTPTMTPNFPTDSFNLVEATPTPTATLQQDRPTPTPSDGFLGYFVQPPLDSSSTNNPLTNQGFSMPAPTPTPTAQTRDNYSQPPSYNAPPRHLGSNDAPTQYPSFGGPNSMQGFFNNNNNGGGVIVGGGNAVGGGGGGGSGNINSNNNGNNNNNKGGGYFSFKK